MQYLKALVYASTDEVLALQVLETFDIVLEYTALDVVPYVPE